MFYICCIKLPITYFFIVKTFPNILHSVNAKSNMLLSWTHYKTLLQVFDKQARDWYEKEAFEQTWSTRSILASSSIFLLRKMFFYVININSNIINIKSHSFEWLLLTLSISSGQVHYFRPSRIFIFPICIY